MKKFLQILVLLVITSAGCLPVTQTFNDQSPSVRTSTTVRTPTGKFALTLESATNLPTQTAVLVGEKIWISPAIPDEFLSTTRIDPMLEPTQEAQEARWRLEIVASNPVKPEHAVRWFYALVAPFPALVDGVSFAELQQSWQGKVEGPAPLSSQPLLVSPETKSVLEELWGPASPVGVREIDEADLLDEAWQNPYHWAIIPFQNLEPRWKVLQIDGKSPLDPSLDPAVYPLAASIVFSGNGLLQPAVQLGSSNREPDAMSTLIMTGTTALVRNTALKMEENGVDYPALDIQNLLKSADITHISNEVPFYRKCPPAVPLRKEMRFCSNPSYIQLLDTVGADIIELTGNHILDWGDEAFLETLDIYQQQGFKTYGGGENIAAAQAVLHIEHNGNRFAFLGCNSAGPESYLATESEPGAAPCDLAAMEVTIRELREQGQIPIVTFQHFEVDDYTPASAQRVDFIRIASAGAEIVSGSQAHFPQGYTFVDGRLVHYGLGNLFFDQMDSNHRRAIIDRHVFYKGRHISTEVLTTKLEDYARPRPMNQAEREKFLLDLFSATGWLP